ncbi:uncharacterized protein LOC109803068 [Cajanus cajan]|uniref:Uncharacterized protein n=1 Tax=Cajanus cajan TaxID=3821 RepID=A0A151TD58_CAJCA|nr:uncharacterized protein LOC109803068 [Cajanus cajan]KYP64992.1 hypothetical protein KK1_019606 [Cajanus cajan]
MEVSSYRSSCKPTIPMGVFCRRRGHIVRASNGRDNHVGKGKLVDENMIVLRLRIKEMKMLEMNREAPSNWMDWEKQCYDHYDEDVCNAIGLLQSYLMGVRPSVALGMLTLVALSVPISSTTLLFCALQMGKSFLSSFGLC